MANPEQLPKLRESVEVWNAWREANPTVEIDLSDANLSDANLSGANLSGANLMGAQLINAHLNNADLSGASLNRADLREAYLSGAKLSGANFSDAQFFGTKLIGVNLSGANLSGANLSGAKVSSAHFSGTKLSNTDFENTLLLGITSFSDVDLSAATGLDSVQFRGPCSIGIDTLYRSKGKIPESFLRGCGVPQVFIDYIPSLVRAVQPIEHYSVFISYSSKDQAFAERLHADLQGQKVRCWFAQEDLKIGEKFRVGIDEAIKVYDKLLLVLSDNSVGSDWVEKEVETAMEKERQQKRTMLFPIRLDDAVTKVETGWPADVRRTRHIGDFTNWKEHDAYKRAFTRLMRDLKADEKTSA